MMLMTMIIVTNNILIISIVIIAITKVIVDIKNEFTFRGYIKQRLIKILRSPFN